MSKPGLVVLGSLAVAAGLVALLLWQSHARPATAAGQKPLLLFCAAGIKPPVEAVAREYEQTFGVQVQLQYGGSGTLLSNLRVADAGDLFLAADESYIKSARALGLLAETIPLARQRPVIAVARGNPKNIRTLEDLRRADVRVGHGQPGGGVHRADGARLAAAGRAMGRVGKAHHRLQADRQRCRQRCEDRFGGCRHRLGCHGAAVSRAGGGPGAACSTAAAETISIGVLKRSQQPAAALRFARYLGARDQGLKQFAKFHYEPVEGDEWAERPEIVLFSGAMLRPGIEKTLKEFEQREGCRITTVYNGCGILVAQMRAGQRPDAYFSCDTSFMNSVADLYLDPVDVVDNHLMIIVQKGNPKGIQTVQDLTKPGLRVGLPHHEKSAMGNIAWKMLVQMNLYDALGQNLKVESPTGDFLINQIRTGSLDAIIACRSNWTGVREHLDAIPIDHPLARMTQPYAVGRSTRYKQMMARLQDALTTAASRERFEAEGFGWRYQPSPAP